jgi:hypothetical protein
MRPSKYEGAVFIWPQSWVAIMLVACWLQTYIDTYICSEVGTYNIIVFSLMAWCIPRVTWSITATVSYCVTNQNEKRTVFGYSILTMSTITIFFYIWRSCQTHFYPRVRSMTPEIKTQRIFLMYRQCIALCDISVAKPTNMPECSLQLMEIRG